MAKPAHINVYGDIENFQAPDAELFGVVSLNSVVSQVSNAGKFDKVVVHIHSRGGSVSEGFAIHDYLRTLNKPITTVIEGLCCSIATVIALAGDERIMTPNSEFMIHNPWTGVEGDAAKMQEAAEVLLENEEKLANFYAEKTGQSVDSLRAMMAEETTFTAERALELGFVTSVAEPVKAYARVNADNADEKINRKIETFMNKKLTEVLAKLGIGKVKALAVTKEDGTELYVETSAAQPEVGNMVYIGTDATGEKAPAGDHTLSDGSTITVDGEGKITAVVAATEDKGGEIVEALKAKIAELEADKAALNAQADEAATAIEGLQAKLAEKENKIVELNNKIGSNYDVKGRKKEDLSNRKPTEEKPKSREERRAEYNKKKPIVPVI